MSIPPFHDPRPVGSRLIRAILAFAATIGAAGVSAIAAPTPAARAGVGAIAAPTPAARADLTIDVDNVRNASGVVHVDVCPEAHFLKDDCPWAGDAPAHVGSTRVTVHDLPAGRYAVQAFHDENRNHRVDRALLGIPKEGIGFSNDAPVRMGPPHFADAVFDFAGHPATIHFRLRYFLGRSGPGA